MPYSSMKATSSRQPTSTAVTFAITSPITCSGTRTFCRISATSSSFSSPSRTSFITGICRPSSYWSTLTAEKPRPPMSGRWVMLMA